MTEIILTEDGSHSLRNTLLNETYHSVHGAIQESMHVFIKNGFDVVTQQGMIKPVSILEIGFGTGLNALLTIQSANTISAEVHYTSLEAYPIPEDVWSKLNYVASIGLKNEFEALHRAPWNIPAFITPHVQLTKYHTTLQEITLPLSLVDLVYFDAFAPNKQPEMWTLPMLEKVILSMRTDGVFVTYCAKGQLKRDLKSLGLQVETLAGPPGKKEMVRAKK